MNDIDLSPEFYVEFSRGGGSDSGVIYHVTRHKDGARFSALVARFFITDPRIPAEGVFRHKRLDCFVIDKSRVPKPERLAGILFEALKKHGAIDEPAWLQWYVAEQRGGKPYGNVLDFE
ncbi:hypothetical protein [Rhizobium ruizarguesonis]|jgi:hypothetical protein|uniref:Uncharacterized protein n=1 Tax=Rhizobium ruizarguesonis TaxID=2081791 RepID=A0AAE8U180_9HYPH|nr:hypothetical protein [Rhizobium ruizarguesonis]MBY5898569.1 hypothetical protein [Rhizobium leguminosarum]NKJ77582.1 hypothetical protein [Rhizobium leguminosarum bv. viciae]MBC2802702.1 hypothetical protein [Rhizobium ruizarguesonis]NEJ98862.1 hypothetical protein [Rhizobium ruizarguesonis]NKQ72146.1 hypothetical protein [Rhizobium ruizarguesonis]